MILSVWRPSVARPGSTHRDLRKLKSTDSHREVAPEPEDDINPVPVHIRVSAHVVDNPLFIFVTTLLTVYALIGDDIRLICTDKPDDIAFNVMVLLCLVIFGVETVISSLGKSDYFLGFFFWLDVISTVSLVLDLTWVTDSIAQQSKEQNTSDMRSGRTARLGAKAGRVVRVLRLVRILKLYKNYNEAARRRSVPELRSSYTNAKPGLEDDWDESDIDFHHEHQNAMPAGESRVGKKLSDITTRRVVCLILAMLLILPSLRSEAVDQTPRSSDYGADHAFLSFQAYVRGTGSREAYEQAMLRYIFFHNWYAGRDPSSFCPLSDSSSGNSCSNVYYGHLFWFGIRGRDAARVQSMAAAAALSESTVAAWAAKTSGPQDGLYNYGTMPPEAQALLRSPLHERCDSGAQARRGLSLIGRRIEGLVDFAALCPDDLRSMEVLPVSSRLASPSEADAWHFVFYFDIRPYVQTDARYNLLVTLFVMVLLILGSMMFAHDANTLILRPVEKMTQRVEAIRENPLVAMKMADDEFRAEEVAKALMKRDVNRGKRFIRDLMTCSMCDVSADEPLETVILEKTIIKLGSLLALGFGEAGANIIAHNMRGAGAGINAMIPGTAVSTIIGCVRIRDFSVTTEVLQAKINAFVNQIAEIVHGICNEFHGAPNKNNGETFLVIWRLSDDEVAPMNARMAEMSVVAFATILGCLHQSPALADYRRHPAMQLRLGTNCRVNLGFGLHSGWAIEGAVGSEFKIDASYLSPHVSIATSIERATELYGVSLMVGQSVIELGSSGLGSHCRLIDRVNIPGSSRPTELYCVDLDHTCISVDVPQPLGVTWNTRQRFKVRQYMDAEKSRMLDGTYDILDLFDTEPTIAAMRSRFTEEFLELYKMGYQNYEEGEWHVASCFFSRTRLLLGIEDGPSCSLLRFMAVHCNEAPRNWQGVRVMDSDQAWLSTGARSPSKGGSAVCSPRQSVAPYSTRSSSVVPL